MLVVVRYLNPTANKALHIGHLRNAVVGNGIADQLEHRGFQVIRQVLIEDVGIFMAEACLASMTAEAPPNQKFDSFVGNLYASFRAGKIARDTISQHAREHGISDAPESFALRLLDASSTEWRHAASLRDRVISCQAETLSRLGISFDEVDFESDELPYCNRLLSQLRSSGFQTKWLATERLRLDTGHIVPLYDAPNVPSENLILLSYVYRQLLNPSYDYVVPIAGREWKNHLSGYAGLLGRAFPSINCKRYVPVFTGHITQAGEKLSSRAGPVILIDQIYEDLFAEVASKLGGTRHTLTTQWMTTILLKVPLLLAPIASDVEAGVELFQDCSSNPGWPIIQAMKHLPDEPPLHLAEICSSFLDFQGELLPVLSDTLLSEDLGTVLALAHEIVSRGNELTWCDPLAMEILKGLFRLGLRPPFARTNWIQSHATRQVYSEVARVAQSKSFHSG